MKSQMKKVMRRREENLEDWSDESRHSMEDYCSEEERHSVHSDGQGL